MQMNFDGDMISVDNVTTCRANAGNNLPLLSFLGVGGRFSTQSGLIFFTNFQESFFPGIRIFFISGLQFGSY